MTLLLAAGACDRYGTYATTGEALGRTSDFVGGEFYRIRPESGADAQLAAGTSRNEFWAELRILNTEREPLYVHVGELVVTAGGNDVLTSGARWHVVRPGQKSDGNGRSVIVKVSSWSGGADDRGVVIKLAQGESCDYRIILARHSGFTDMKVVHVRHAGLRRSGALVLLEATLRLSSGAR